MTKKKSILDKLFEGLAPMTDAEKQAIIKEAKAKEANAKADYIRGGHKGFMGGFWTGD